MNEQKKPVEELSKGDVIEFDVPVIATNSYETVQKEILRIKCVGHDGRGGVKIEFVENGDNSSVESSYKYCSFDSEFVVVDGDGGEC